MSPQYSFKKYTFSLSDKVNTDIFRIFVNVQKGQRTFHFPNNKNPFLDPLIILLVNVHNKRVSVV